MKIKNIFFEKSDQIMLFMEIDGKFKKEVKDCFESIKDN